MKPMEAINPPVGVGKTPCASTALSSGGTQVRRFGRHSVSRNRIGAPLLGAVTSPSRITI